jgi:prepilin signal peptidase PulO-like enzyme (type II secretory pathway)
MQDELAVITPFVAGYLVLASLLVGSFVNLAADRLPRGESLIRPRSQCRSCGRQLNVVDLLPVAGYLIRRGKCATCGTPIGAASPVVEAACGALMGVALLVLGLWPGAALGLVLVALWGVLVTSISLQKGTHFLTH